MTDDLVRLSIEDKLAVVTLNRPDARNALSSAMRRQLTDVLVSLRSNPDARVVVLTGAGKGFCAGLDLNELQAAGGELAQGGIIGAQMLDAIAALDIPLIAAVNGFAITGGLELALCCDVIIASREAFFADTHARVGIVPAWGVTQRLPRIIGPMRAKEMSLSGRRIGAALAFQWGLVNCVVEAEALMEAACGLAREMIACDAAAQREIKALIDEGWLGIIEQGLQREQAASRAAFERFSAGNAGR
jgi:enoyl-CoA hydratase